MAYLSVDEMRQAIKKPYSGVGWARRVANMHDMQVIAVYYKFLEEGKFDRKPLPVNKKEEKQIQAWFDQTYEETDIQQLSLAGF